jgi:hypothetical protein
LPRASVTRPVTSTTRRVKHDLNVAQRLLGRAEEQRRVGYIAAVHAHRLQCPSLRRMHELQPPRTADPVHLEGAVVVELGTG